MNIKVFFSVIYLSFFSKNLYKQITKVWRQEVIIYLLLINLISSSFLCLRWLREISKVRLSQNHSIDEPIDNNYSNQLVMTIINQIPTLFIQNNQIATNDNKPIFIKNPISNDLLIIIDTSQAQIDHNKYKAKVYLSKREIIFKNNDYFKKYYIKQLFNNQNIILTQEKLISLFNNFKKILFWLIPLIILPIMTLINSLLLLIKAGIYTLIGSQLGKRFGLYLIDREYFILAVVSLTPSVVIQSILNLINIDLAYKNFLLFVISASYFIFALSIHKTPTNNE